MSSVGRAYAILRGRTTGDKEKASSFLEGLSPTRRIMQNRAESRMRARARKKPYMIGRKPRARPGSVR